MIRVFKLLFISIFISTVAAAQDFDGTLFHQSACWLGLDFSEAKMVGSSKFGDAGRVKDYYMKEWNNVVVFEMRKYNFTKHYKIKDVAYRKEITDSVNVKIDATDLFTEESTEEFTPSKLQEIVNKYDLSKVDKKYAFSYIIQEFNGKANTATIWITVIDVETKQIVKYSRMQEKARGGGFRNFWLGAVFETLLQSRKMVAKEWK